MKIEKTKIESENKYDQLKELWCEVFGDEPSYVDSVYNSLDAIGWILAVDDKVVSALTTFDVGAFDGQTIVCIYAVCTAPEFRGNGYASELVRAAAADIETSGKRALVSPASPTLQNYYADLGFTPTCYAQQKTLSLFEQDEFSDEDFDEEEGVFPTNMQVKLQTINAATYGEYREKFLGSGDTLSNVKFQNSNHIVLSRKFLDFILDDSYNGQGMLLVNGGDAICVFSGCEDAACESENTVNNCEAAEKGMKITLAELIVNPALSELSLEIDEQLAIGIAELLEADSITYRMPAMTDNFKIESDTELGENCIYVQAMLSGNAGNREPYFGFPMD